MAGWVVGVRASRKPSTLISDLPLETKPPRTTPALQKGSKRQVKLSTTAGLKAQALCWEKRRGHRGWGQEY